MGLWYRGKHKRWGYTRRKARGGTSASIDVSHLQRQILQSPGFVKRQAAACCCLYNTHKYSTPITRRELPPPFFFCFVCLPTLSPPPYNATPSLHREMTSYYSRVAPAGWLVCLQGVVVKEEVRNRSVIDVQCVFFWGGVEGGTVWVDDGRWGGKKHKVIESYSEHVTHTQRCLVLFCQKTADGIRTQTEHVE